MSNCLVLGLDLICWQVLARETTMERIKRRDPEVLWPIVLMATIILVFMIDIIVVAALGPPDIPRLVTPSGAEWDQWIFGVIAMVRSY